MLMITGGGAGIYIRSPRTKWRGHDLSILCHDLSSQRKSASQHRFSSRSMNSTCALESRGSHFESRPRELPVSLTDILYRSRRFESCHRRSSPGFHMRSIEYQRNSLLTHWVLSTTRFSFGFNCAHQDIFDLNKKNPLSSA